MSWWFWRKPIDYTVKTYEVGGVRLKLYKDIRVLRVEYLNRGGDLKIARRLKGFADMKNLSIHSIDNSKVIGHELKHLMGFKHKKGEVFESD